MFIWGHPAMPGVSCFGLFPGWFEMSLAESLVREKFQDPDKTASGSKRAWVGLDALRILWINTGTLCNITCAHCYIESSPRNDRLEYIRIGDVLPFIDEIERNRLGTSEIGLTGGEPFMNPDIMAMLSMILERGFRVLVLTNAMKPMRRHDQDLRALQSTYGDRLRLRVSLDHYSSAGHETERGRGTWKPGLEGLIWLAHHGFSLSVAGRLGNETEDAMRAGYSQLFNTHNITIDARDPESLVLFPEMDEDCDTPEITEKCWDILGVDPGAMMCASSRMLVKRKGSARPSVLACTLIPYDQSFELGGSLAEASGPVSLNHPHCSRFCVLGGASCARAS